MTEETAAPPAATPVVTQETDNPLPATAPAKDAASAQPGNKGLWMGTAVGIGSAALVAALLYAKRKK